jgi:NADP-dependent 3-hydroxy acid dehydrogenase YdfG
MKGKLAEKVVFVTGASSGIGAALAREAAAQGAAVVLAARRLERIAGIAGELEAAGGKALAVRCDVTAEGDLDAAVAQAMARFGRLDVVVANAGFGVGGQLARLSVDDYRRQFETNVFGLIRTVHATLAPLAASGGALGLVGSANGYLSIPRVSAYCASKHAVRSLAVCLRHELAPRGISVTHLVPGFVQSEIRQVDNQGEFRADAPDPVPRWLQMPAPTAARKMLRALVARRSECVITLHGKAGVFLARHTPWLVSAALRLRRGAQRRGAAPQENLT